MNVPVRRYVALLITYLRPQTRRFILTAVLLLGGIGLQIVIPQITRSFLDAAQGGSSGDQLTLAALGFIGLALFQQIVTAATTYFSENVAWSATNALRADLTRHCLRLDMTFHNNRTVGELIERIDGDVDQLADFFSSLVVVIIGNLLLVAGILVVLAREDWRMGIGFLIFAILALASLASVRNIAIPFERARQQANAALYGYLEERLVATEDIRSSGAVGTMIGGLYRMQAAVLARWIPAVHRVAVLSFVSGMVVTGGYCVAFIASYNLFQLGTITLGTAYLILNYAILLNRPFQQLTSRLDQMQGIGASIERVEELLNIESKIQDGAGTTPLPPGALSLQFEQVTFGYDSAEAVLHDLNFTVKPGQIMGILGRTGSGKTTLSRLVFRLYDADSGSIRLGGVNIRDLKLAELRQRVAMVTQDVQLFEASIRDNLTFFDEHIPDAEIMAVFERLGLADWLAGLPNGLDSPVEAGGRNLSAGEAQLLAFARVFLRNPGLVILDEASARLDPATEQRLETAVDHLTENRSAIIIAHRLATVRRVDTILILENGHIVEYGERERLAADPQSRFYHLLQTGLEDVLS
jgi:ATP-binding cassette, subfamily B, bacterial